MKYRWKDRSGTKGLSADVAAERLEAIRAANAGRITPHAVVADAEPEDSPLHPAFEWDDTKAAQQHRINQARELIQNVVVVFAGKSDQEPVRAFVNVMQSGDSDRSYTSMAHAMSDADLRKQVVAMALAEVKAWKKRYADYRELEAIFSAIAKAEAA